MANVRVRPETGKIYFDFTFMQKRFREYTAMPNTAANRKQAEVIAKRIQAEIDCDAFSYEKYFPKSTNLEKANAMVKQAEKIGTRRQRIKAGLEPDMPTLNEFAEIWLQENEVRWRKATVTYMHQHTYLYILPKFGKRVVSEITRAEILSFRSELAKAPGLKGKPLSARTINAHMSVLKTLLGEAAARYQFMSPVERIPSLKIKRSDVQPFSLVEVQQVINAMPRLYKNYVSVRFFTGLRTAEADGLRWEDIDWDRKQILVRTSAAEDGEIKNDGSYRHISMSGLVYDALVRQKDETKQVGDLVFCSRDGGPFDSANFNKRIWKKALMSLGLAYRCPYQMRHTAATLWLASGEAPEWIARQLGHTSTQMLFKTYSRFVPNLTRRDGAAFEQMMSANGFVKTAHAVSQLGGDL